MTGKQAAEAVKAKYPKLAVAGVYDYDDEHYVVEALENPSKVDYGDPYYGVDKSEAPTFSSVKLASPNA